MFRDGSCVVIHKDIDATCASLGALLEARCGNLPRFASILRTNAAAAESLLYNAPLPIDQLRDRLSGPQGRELLSHAQHDLFSVARKYFDDDRIRTLFTSYMHVITTENEPGAGLVFPAIFANVMEFTLPVGGAISLPEALRRIVRSGGWRRADQLRGQGDPGSRTGARPAFASPLAI